MSAFSFSPLNHIPMQIQPRGLDSAFRAAQGDWRLEGVTPMVD